MQPVDVVVIGAGIAGLSAAWRLVQAGRSVCVLEARERVGGRIYGFEVGERSLQLGGRWTGPGQDAVKGLARELGVGVRAHSVFDTVIAEQPALEAAARRIDVIADTVDLDAPWETPRAREWDGQTLATWLKRELSPDTARSVGARLTGFLPQPEDLSFLHALFYLKSNRGFAGILGLDGPAHDSEMFDGGAHAITNRLAARLGDHIALDIAVQRVIHDADKVSVCAGSQVFTAKSVIVAIPPVLAGRLQYDPALPPERDYLTQRMPIRGKIAIAVLYADPAWRNATNRCAFSERLSVWDEGGETLPIAYSGLVSIPWSMQLWRLDAPQRRAAIVDEMAIGIGEDARTISGYHEVYWAAESWSRGCNSFMTTGTWTAWGQALREPVGSIYWAGAEMSPVFVGQMDGAVRSAEQVVEQVLATLD